VNALPTWDKMSELDRGAVLLHLWKREREGASYAVSDYPAEFFNDPQLTALGPADACRHAVYVIGSYSRACDLLGDDEVAALYELALTADRDRVLTRLRAES
jgi:hypothetical protein